jgi:hypothetical protein
MPTRLVNPKSPRGESGQDDNSELLTEEIQMPPEVASPVTEDCEKLVTQQIPDPVSDPEPAAAVAAEESDNTVVTLSPADRKIADRMSRDIANHLGLGGRSRSVKI